MMFLSKKIRTWFLSLSVITICLLLILALYYRTRLVFDWVRLYLQKHVITAISDIRYRYQVGKEVNLSNILSARYLAPGDIIFTSEDSSLGSIFIDGKRKHMLMYLWTPRQLRLILGKDSHFFQKIKNLKYSNNTPLIIESTFDGVRIHPFSELEPRESFVAIRVEVSKTLRRWGFNTLGQQRGKDYDFDFSFENDELYCSELFYPVFLKRWLHPKIEEWILRDVISPTGMLSSLFDTQLSNRMVHLLFYVSSEEGVPHFMSKEQLLLTL